MSFRQFGGLNYATKHNIVSSNYNTSDNLLVTKNVGQPNSYINFLSDISGNVHMYGDVDISGNLHVSGDIDVGKNVNINGNSIITGTLAVSGSITNTATQPASNDSSTKVPTTAWVQSAINSSSESTITRIYKTTQTITTPSNCRSVDITIVARGGDCGASALGPPVYFGGSGSGGNMLTGSGIMIGQSQSLDLTVNNTTNTGSYYITWNNVIIARAYNGSKGGDALVGGGGYAGPVTTTASIVDNTLGSWTLANGRAGASGNTNPPSTASPNSCPKNISNWGSNILGCGQRTTDYPTPTGYIMLTFHCG